MKKKVLILISVVLITGFVIYKFAYKKHRNIGDEKADYALTVIILQDEFNKNDSLFNKKYLDRTIEIYGKITNIDLYNNAVTIDQKLIATFKDKDLNKLTLLEPIKVKGRFIGYDDLLEEFKIDESVILK